jgi:hypothetical protein
MYQKYLQVCFNIRSRKIGVEDDQSFGRLIDDITVFAPVGLYSRYVVSLFMLRGFTSSRLLEKGVLENSFYFPYSSYSFQSD